MDFQINGTFVNDNAHEVRKKKSANSNILGQSRIWVETLSQE
jgi:hypothetical protein